MRNQLIQHNQHNKIKYNGTRKQITSIHKNNERARTIRIKTYNVKNKLIGGGGTTPDTPNNSFDNIKNSLGNDGTLSQLRNYIYNATLTTPPTLDIDSTILTRAINLQKAEINDTITKAGIRTVSSTAPNLLTGNQPVIHDVDLGTEIYNRVYALDSIINLNFKVVGGAKWSWFTSKYTGIYRLAYALQRTKNLGLVNNILTLDMNVSAYTMEIGTDMLLKDTTINDLKNIKKCSDTLILISLVNRALASTNNINELLTMLTATFDAVKVVAVVGDIVNFKNNTDLYNKIQLAIDSITKYIPVATPVAMLQALKTEFEKVLPIVGNTGTGKLIAANKPLLKITLNLTQVGDVAVASVAGAAAALLITDFKTELCNFSKVTEPLYEGLFAIREAAITGTVTPVAAVDINNTVFSIKAIKRELEETITIMDGVVKNLVSGTININHVDDAHTKIRAVMVLFNGYNAAGGAVAVLYPAVVIDALTSAEEIITAVNTYNTEKADAITTNLIASNDKLITHDNNKAITDANVNFKNALDALKAHAALAIAPTISARLVYELKDIFKDIKPEDQILWATDEQNKKAHVALLAAHAALVALDGVNFKAYVSGAEMLQDVVHRLGFAAHANKIYGTAAGDVLVAAVVDPLTEFNAKPEGVGAFNALFNSLRAALNAVSVDGGGGGIRAGNDTGKADLVDALVALVNGVNPPLITPANAETLKLDIVEELINAANAIMAAVTVTKLKLAVEALAALRHGNKFTDVNSTAATKLKVTTAIALIPDSIAKMDATPWSLFSNDIKNTFITLRANLGITGESMWNDADAVGDALDAGQSGLIIKSLNVVAGENGLDANYKTISARLLSKLPPDILKGLGEAADAIKTASA